MRLDFLDRYSRLDSPVHRVPAAWKLALTLAIVFAIVLQPPGIWGGLGAATALLVVVVALSRIPVGFLLKRLLLFEPFVLGVALLTLWQPGGGKIFVFLVVKSTLCLLTMVLLSNTAPFRELLRVLRTWGVPALLITTIALMYRYLFVLVDESERMRRARASRTFTPRRRSDWHVRASVVSQLFVRSSERAERIYAAMCARGWK